VIDLTLFFLKNFFCFAKTFAKKSFKSSFDKTFLPRKVLCVDGK